VKKATVTYHVSGPGWYAGTMHDQEGKVLGQHVSSSLNWLKLDMRSKLENPEEWEIEYEEEGDAS
jgi:hypothetical protein